MFGIILTCVGCIYEVLSTHLPNTTTTTTTNSSS